MRLTGRFWLGAISIYVAVMSLFCLQFIADLSPKGNTLMIGGGALIILVCLSWVFFSLLLLAEHYTQGKGKRSTEQGAAQWEPSQFSCTAASQRGQ